MGGLQTTNWIFGWPEIPGYEAADALGHFSAQPRQAPREEVGTAQQTVPKPIPKHPNNSSEAVFSVYFGGSNTQPQHVFGCLGRRMIHGTKGIVGY